MDPAYISNTRWDVLAWNSAAEGLFRDLALTQRTQPNMIRFLFTSPRLRALHVDWETQARVSLEKFRMDFWRHRNRSSFNDLVAELQAVSDEFRQWWDSPLIHPLEDGVKVFRRNGKAVEYSYNVLTLSATHNQRLVVFAPATQSNTSQVVRYAAQTT